MKRPFRLVYVTSQGTFRRSFAYIDNLIGFVSRHRADWTSFYAFVLEDGIAYKIVFDFDGPVHTCFVYR